jgi:NADPH:quinone reductase-like Zn-dependent oxidoreductase
VLHAVRLGGTISVIGMLAGTTTSELALTSILMNKLRVQGILLGNRESFEAMNRAIDLDQLRPVIDRVFPFEEAPAAFAHLKSGQHFGKVCLRLG